MSYRYGKAKIDWFIKQVRNKEVILSFARSSGPWWQHINKVETKVQLNRDIATSQIIPQPYLQRIITNCDKYISKEWILRLDTQVHRTQKANKEQTKKKLAKLIKSWFTEKETRKKTKPPKWAVDKRIAEKKRRSKTRSTRRKIV